ncbi:DUF397 domain-containing protein [Streptomyces sp. NBC_00872]|uniref:DUF397 domain-containing protein n=1 Tax=Streptomyces sp. NBC_00872 TaxID=2903686 RepID=UPI003870C936|nr:DUF397 domain-containing protein [Streptomyces sp. NBC_00872]
MSSSEQFVGWRKSSYSSGNNDNCLEVADGYASIPVRDSKNPTGPTLLFQPTNWSSFIESVKAESLQA